MNTALKALALAAAFCLAFTPVLRAQASTNAREVEVMARAVGFVDGLPRGVLDTAIVDGPGASNLLSAIGDSGVSGGGVLLVARRVSLDDLSRSGARVIVVPEGQQDSHSAIAAVASRMGAVTVSTDMTCVRQDHCVIGVATSPRVEIRVSRAAARNARVRFAQAFRVMIREE